MLDKANIGLVVVDIQGKLARLVDDADAIISQTQKLITGAKILGLPIIWLEQNPEKLGDTVAEIKTHLSEYSPITKYTFNGSGEPKFINAIQASGKTSWLVCGIEAHICVYQTATHLSNLNYNVHLVCDAISSRAQRNKTLALEKMQHNGIAITGVEMCLYELVKDCRASEFKSILNLIK